MICVAFVAMLCLGSLNAQNARTSVNPIKTQVATLTSFSSSYQVTDNATRTPRGLVKVTLEAHNVWGDNSGYHMLLDGTATQYGVGFPGTGNPWSSCPVPSSLYNWATHKIPENATATCASHATFVAEGSVTIYIPAGTYDFCFANLEMGADYWFPSDLGNFIPRQDNYNFLEGKAYHFLALRIGSNDGINLTITDDNNPVDPCPAVTNVTATQSGANKVIVNWTAPAGKALTNYKIYQNGVEKATVAAGTTTWTSGVLTSGTYTFAVEAIYSDGCVPVKVAAAPITIATCDDKVTNVKVEYAASCAIATISWTDLNGKKAPVAPTQIMGNNINVKTGMVRENSSALTFANRIPNLNINPETPQGDLRSYADAYVFDAGATSYSSVNLATGNTTSVAYMSTDLFPTGEDFDGTDIYRLFEDNTVVKVSETGTTTSIGTITGLQNFGIGFAYDWVGDGSWYFTDIVTAAGGYAPFTQYLYKISLPSLTKTLVGTFPTQNSIIYRGLTMGNDGFLYAVANDYSSSSTLVKINKTNGQITTVGSIGFSTWYGMDLEFDRQTNTLYAGLCDYNNGNGGIGHFGTINPTSGAFTSIKTIGQYQQYASLVITKSSNLNIAKAPEPVTATAVGTELKADIAWKNPTQTLAGAALGTIQKIVIERAGAVIKEFTSVTPGQEMTYTDASISTPGQYCYDVYAVTSEGNGAKGGDCAKVYAGFCEAKVVVSNVSYGDEFDWSLKDEGGVQLLGSSGNVTAGTYIALFDGEVYFEVVGYPNWGDNEGTFSIEVDGDVVHTYQLIAYGYSSGVLDEFTLECSGLYTYTYNVYRDNVKIASAIEEAIFEDKTFDPSQDYTWSVAVVCKKGGEGEWVGVSKDACSGCHRVTNAKAEVTCSATLTWNAVDGATGYKIVGASGETTVTGTTYTETGTFVGGQTYTWKIITLCVDGQSAPVEVSGVSNCDGISEFGNTISIYPNPANSTVNIKAENFAKVEVYSSIGQLIVTQNTTTIDVSNYQAGVYFFKVFDNNNNTAMKRISVIK